ncbi:LPP20 lipoprotein [Ferrimonas sediminum]|uniref:LPP20 lipoprotein n=1 Tax=Ferrimonas sediminum TaxID=718193 RepID=A0A1G8LXH0_9GAMM|nr:LPP20 family lipoprotein [Ferrimonas sediminum]SDI59840.1 LPP20 lipoprotein [Ferrimonas sediminum]
MLLRPLALVLFLLHTTACVATVPSWYLAPPADTASHLYGVGAGLSPLNARQQALIDITSRLQVRVQGRLKAHTQTLNGQVDQRVEQQVESENAAFTLSNYELYESAHDKNTFYQLIRVDRPALMAGLEQQLNQHLEQLSQLRQQPMSSLRQFRKLNQNLTTADTARALAGVLEQQQHPVPDLAPLSWFERRLAEHKANSSILLEFTDTSPQTEAFVSQWLDDSGFQVSGPNPIAILKFNIDAQPARELFGQYHVRLDGKLTVVDQGQIVHTKRLTSTGVSSLSEAQAKAVAEQQLLKQIAGENIWQLLLPM